MLIIFVAIMITLSITPLTLASERIFAKPLHLHHQYLGLGCLRSLKLNTVRVVCRYCRV